MQGPVPRRERKKAQTRKALLEVGLRLIGERGVYGTRIEDITEMSDLGKGVFYNYFRSKNALVAALVSYGVETLCDRYLDRVPDLAPVGERVAALVRGHEAFFDEHPVFVVLFHQARGVAKMGDVGGDLESVFVDYLKRIGDLLVGPGGRGTRSARRRMDLAAAVLGSIAGYRSFRVAAGLAPVDHATFNEVLLKGLPATLADRGLLRRRRRG